MSDVITVVQQLADATGSRIAGLDAAVLEVNTKRGDLATLSTTAKASIVAAVNEVYGQLTTAQSALAANSTALAGKASTDDVTTAIGNLRTELMGGDVTETLDTFKEVADTLQSYGGDITSLVADMAGAVSFVKDQTGRPESEKLQARLNVGAASAAELTAVDAKIGNVAENNVMDTFNGHFA